jgi:Holliday junction resolvase RusA-like endonuclease
MHKIQIKPLSVNDSWQGKRFKTPEYKAYEVEMLYKLPPLNIKGDFLHISIEFGFSSSRSDIDNPVKPLLDIFQKKYGFNDSSIYSLSIKKNKVEKGSEYINFEIKEYDEFVASI